jgi:hypothetical protein
MENALLWCGSDPSPGLSFDIHNMEKNEFIRGRRTLVTLARGALVLWVSAYFIHIECLRATWQRTWLIREGGCLGAAETLVCCMYKS